MENRIREVCGKIKIPEDKKEEMLGCILMDNKGKSGKKSHWGMERWGYLSAAVILVFALFGEPIETLARQLFFPAEDVVTGKAGIQKVNIGEMAVTQLQKPENMKPVHADTVEAGQCYFESQLVGNRKQYELLSDMEKETGISFLHSKELEEEPFSSSLCIYDQQGLSVAIVDTKFFYGKGEEKAGIFMEIVMELENASEDYQYAVNQESDYEGIYQRGDGLFDAMILKNQKVKSLSWWKEIPSEKGDGVIFFEHPFRYHAPIDTYGAVFYCEGMRYYIYGAESTEILEEILGDLAKR